MSRRVITSRSKKQNERPIRKNIDNFSGGMVKDIEPTEIPKNAMYHLDNVVGFQDRLDGRRGSALFSESRLPIEKTIFGDLVNGVFTRSDTGNGGDTFSSVDVGKFLCFWEDGKNFSLPIEEIIDDSTVTIEKDGEYINTEVHVRGAINGSFFDGVEDLVLMVLGEKIYNCQLIYTDTEATFTPWKELFSLGTDTIKNSMCDIYEISENYFINNENGIFRVDIQRGYFWKCNQNGPLIENKITERLYETPFEFGYRYIHTFSRFDDNYYTNRLNGILTHETPPTVIRNSDEKDYSVVYSKLPRGYRYLNIGFPFDDDLDQNSPEYWRDIGKSAIKVYTGKKGTNILEWDVTYVYFDFTIVESLFDVMKIFNDSFKQVPVNVEFTLIDENDGVDNRKRIIHIFNDETIIMEISSYDLPDPSEVYEKIKILTIIDFESTDRGVERYPGIENDVVGGLTVSENPFQTHFSVYRTDDTSGFDNNGDDVYRYRDINDPNVYVWVDDIPVMEVIPVTTNGLVLVTAIEPLERNIGCVVSLLGETRQIVDVVENGYLLDSAPPLDGVSTCSVIGFSVETEVPKGFTDEVTGEESYVKRVDGIQGITLSELKVGELIFWDDGDVSVVKQINTAQNNFYVIDNSPVKPQLRFFATKPGERSFNDRISDDVLEARRRVLPLKTRFFEAMGNNNLSTVIPGFYITAKKNSGSFEYCSTADLSLIGSRHQVGQINDFIDSDIQKVSWVSKLVSLKTSHSTFVFDPQQAFDAGDSRFNESFFSFPDPIKVSDAVGVISPAHCITVKDGLELVFTNEPAIRFYDGQQYGNDVSKDKVFNSLIIPFYKNVLMDYDNAIGVMLYGTR